MICYVISLFALFTFSRAYYYLFKSNFKPVINRYLSFFCLSFIGLLNVMSNSRYEPDKKKFASKHHMRFGCLGSQPLRVFAINKMQK